MAWGSHGEPRTDYRPPVPFFNRAQRRRSTAMYHFNASRGGHAPGHLREFLWAVLDKDEVDIESAWPRRMPKDVDPLAWICGQLHNCTDTMPADRCDDLDVSRGSSYAQGTRSILSDLSRGTRQILTLGL
jgi:hypothetical protein